MRRGEALEHGIGKQRSLKAVLDEGCVRFTYQRLCVPGLTLYLSRRTLGRGLLSLCRGYTSESWSSPFFVSSGSRLSSPHIHLEHQEKWGGLINTTGFNFAAWKIFTADRCHVWFYLIWLLLYTLLSSPVSLSILTRAGDNLLQYPAAKIVLGAAVYRAERSSKMLHWR